MIDYCPNNETFLDFWTKHGVTHCFMDTIGAVVPFSFIFIFGSIQLLMYRKYAIPNEDVHLMPKSRLYALQIFFLLLFPLLQIIRFILAATVYTDFLVQGYMVRGVFS